MLEEICHQLSYVVLFALPHHQMELAAIRGIYKYAERNNLTQ